MRAKTMAAVIVAVMFAAALGIVYTKTVAVAKRVATLTNVKGSVTVKAVGTTQWVDATERMAINEGDEIKTEGRSSAIIKMDDGSMIKVGPLAKMKVDMLVKEGKDNKTSMGVTVGKTWNRVNRLTGDAAFNVKTPTAVAGVRGTYFSSEVADTSDSTFDVFEGSVSVAGADDPSASVMVGANQRTQVAPGKSPGAPGAIPADQLDAGKGGFSDAEAAMATYDLQISISPQVLEPGQKAAVSIQVFKNGQPFKSEVAVKLTLSGSAKFVDSGSAEMELTTDPQGAATIDITSSEKETVTVTAELRIKVPKK